MKPEAFPAKTAAFVPYVKEDFFVKDKKNTPQVLARRALLVLLDAAIVAFSFYFALLLRADGAVEAAWWPHNRELLYENLPWIVAVYIASFLFSGLYSVLWKYAGERDLMRLAGTVAVPTVVVYCVNRLCIHGVLFNSANCMAAVLIFLLVGGSRLAWRLFLNHPLGEKLRGAASKDPNRPVMIVGAGEAGAWAINVCKSNKEYGHAVVAVDDDPTKLNQTIHGVPVKGTLEDIPDLCKRYGIHSIIIAIPTLKGSKLNHVIDLCVSTHCAVQLLSDPQLVGSGAPQQEVFRELNPADFLSREEVERLKTQYPAIRGIGFARNYGKSAALYCGFAAAEGEVVITMDADLQDSPDEIPALRHMVLDEGYDLVSGWKKKRHDPAGKRWPSKFFNWTARIVSGIRLHDFNCGLKAYRRRVVKAIEVYGEMHRYIPILAKQAGFKRIGEKVVEHRARKYGHSKFGMERMVKGYLDLITVSFLSRFGRSPMYFFGSLGTLMFLFGGCTTAWVIGVKLYKQCHDLPVRAVTDQPLFYLSLLAVVLGVQLFLAGFLGELIDRNAADRNKYLIEKTLDNQ